MPVHPLTEWMDPSKIKEEGQMKRVDVDVSDGGSRLSDGYRSWT